MKVYLISNGSLIAANRQYTKLDAVYEIQFNKNTIIKEIESESDVPDINFKVLKLNEINFDHINEKVDVIGIINEISETSSLFISSNQKNILKRDLAIIDETNSLMNVTLWGSKATEISKNDLYQVVLIKDAIVKNFVQFNLSVGGSSTLLVNPNITGVCVLKKWFQNERNCNETSKIATNKACLSFLNEHIFSDKPIFIESKAIIITTPQEKCMYESCFNCNMKVIYHNNDTFKCEKCNKNYEKAEWKYVMNIQISDYTNSTWVTCFDKAASCILGIEAKSLKGTNEKNVRINSRLNLTL